MSNPEETLPARYEFGVVEKKSTSYMSPRLLTPERKKKILSILLIGGSETAAAEYAGIAQETYNIWKKAGKKADPDSPDPAERKMAEFYMETRKAIAEDKVGDLAMLKNIIKENYKDKPVEIGKLIIDAMKHKHPEEYNPVRHHKGGTTVVQDNREIILAINSLPDDKLDRLLEITEELETVDAEVVDTTAITPGDGKP